MTERNDSHHGYYEPYTDTPDEHLVEGFDPEVALDLGIPIDHESLTSHQASAQEVKDALSRRALTEAEEYAELEAREGRVLCANCNKPGCPGCGRS